MFCNIITKVLACETLIVWKAFDKRNSAIHGWICSNDKFCIGNWNRNGENSKRKMKRKTKRMRRFYFFFCLKYTVRFPAIHVDTELIKILNIFSECFISLKREHIFNIDFSFYIASISFVIFFHFSAYSLMMLIIINSAICV